jgi:predicted flap endonuclease-1-like 5' DNA nuclease
MTSPEYHSTDFPLAIGKVAMRELHLAGYFRLEQLATVTERDLLKIHGLGPKAVRLLRAALDEEGLAFAADAPKKQPSKRAK